MKISSVLAIFLIITLLVCGCTSNTSVSNSGGLTSTTHVSQNSDDLYIQYIAEYSKSYDEQRKPLKNLKIGTSDYSTIKSVFTDIQVLSKTYYGKISPLTVSPQNELSKKYYLEFLNTMQQHSESIIAAPYPKNPSNQSEYFQFDRYMTSLNSQITLAATYEDNALNSDVCKMLLDKQNMTRPICRLKTPHSSGASINSTTDIQVTISPTEISQTTIIVPPEIINRVLANPTRHCVGSSGYLEWRYGRAVSGIFCVDS